DDEADAGKDGGKKSGGDGFEVHGKITAGLKVKTGRGVTLCPFRRQHHFYSRFSRRFRGQAREFEQIFTLHETPAPSKPRAQSSPEKRAAASPRRKPARRRGVPNRDFLSHAQSKNPQATHSSTSHPRLRHRRSPGHDELGRGRHPAKLGPA